MSHRLCPQAPPKGRPWTIPQGTVAGMEVSIGDRLGEGENDQDLDRAEEEQSEWRRGWLEALRARVHERHKLIG